MSEVKSEANPWRARVGAEMDQLFAAHPRRPRAPVFPRVERSLEGGRSKDGGGRRRRKGGVVMPVAAALLVGVAIGALLPIGYGYVANQRGGPAPSAVKPAPSIAVATAPVVPAAPPSSPPPAQLEVATAPPPASASQPPAASNSADAAALRPTIPAPAAPPPATPPAPAAQTQAQPAARPPSQAPSQPEEQASAQPPAAPPKPPTAEERIAAADRALEQAYETARRAGVPSFALREDRDHWAAIRADAAQRSTSSLLAAYNARIHDLAAMAAEARAAGRADAAERR